MPDVIEMGPPGVDQSDSLTLYWVEKIADPAKPTLAEMKLGVRITYDMIPGGYDRTGDQEVTKDERLTQSQSRESLGKSTAGLALEYVESQEPKSANMTLLEGKEGYIVERRGLPNSTEEAVKQKVLPIKVRLGKQIPGGIAGTGNFTTKQKTSVVGNVGLPVEIVAP
ncbi:hypothetical protein [Mycetocola saprophilus]|uniref:phage tail tube protein n=1 Tax=Mycetocola saprophilus TaxID=76636 RepID=UPI003BF26022